MSKVNEELENLYQLSRWSKRFSEPQEVLDHHFKFIENASQEVRRNIQCQLNIPYGSSERQKIDIFGIDLNDDAPIFVFIHGGYWQRTEVRRDSYEFIAKILYENGIKTIFIGYDLCPSVTIPQIIQQIQQAAIKCVEYAKEKGSKGIYFGGHSAGGHLTSSLFVAEISSTLDRSVIKGALLISGVYDPTPLLKTTVSNPLRLDENVAHEVSTLKKILEAGKETEFHVIVGALESPEIIRQAKEFDEKVKNLGLKSHYVLVDDVDHYDILELLSKEDYQLTKYIIGLIKNTK